MKFRRYFVETFSDDIDGVIHFADKSQIKLSGIGSIRLKILNFADYLLQDVLYIP